jgi:NAD(P)-dependent dehydrogenase (short-subunit alcohol dehydrogenase family)
MRLQGKAAIVTGSTSGIGRATAILFALEGAAVAIAGRGEETGEAVVQEILSRGGQAFYLRTDVSVRGDCERLVQETVARYGKLDILFNNAGIGLWKHLLETTDDDWDRVFSTNLRGMFFMTRAAVPEMAKAGGGSILNCGSIREIMPSPDLVAYGATKGGIAAFTRALALDLAPMAIRANCIAPGYIRTRNWDDWFDSLGLSDDERQRTIDEAANRHPVKRVGTPQDIAYAALYLASDEASFVTGAWLLIDGGLHLT